MPGAVKLLLTPPAPDCSTGAHISKGGRRWQQIGNCASPLPYGWADRNSPFDSATSQRASCTPKTFEAAAAAAPEARAAPQQARWVCGRAERRSCCHISAL